MTHLHAIDTILFDLDGTLTDPKVGITESVRYAMRKMKRPLSPETNLDWCIGPPLQENFARLLDTTDPARIDEAIRLFRERFGTVGLYENEPYPDMPDVLAQLQTRGFRLFIATSKPTLFAAKIVAHFNLDVYFEAIYGSELDGTRSHKPDLIRYVLQQEQLNHLQAVMIGDREHDVLGAKANGMAAVGVTYGYGQEEALNRAGANWICRHPAQILQLVVLLR
ncbi:MAG: HAD family hydrolase [Anaerolineales bacterium]|nr:HAD family hydrolase [Anaerolineales bacterium]